MSGENAGTAYESIPKGIAVEETTLNVPLWKPYKKDGTTPTHIDAHENAILDDFGSCE